MFWSITCAQVTFNSASVPQPTCKSLYFWWYSTCVYTCYVVSGYHADNKINEEAFKLLTREDLSEMKLSLGGRKILEAQLQENHPPKVIISTYCVVGTFGKIFKVMGDHWHKEIFTSTKPFVSWQRKQLWSWNKCQNEADMVIKADSISLKASHYQLWLPLSLKISCVKFCSNKGFYVATISTYLNLFQCSVSNFVKVISVPVHGFCSLVSDPVAVLYIVIDKYYNC